MRLLKEPHCQCCGTNERNKFWGRQKSTCYECYKVIKAEKYASDKSEELHLCLDCGEDQPQNFYGNSKTRCKECTYNRAKPNIWNSGACMCKDCGTEDPNLFDLERNRSRCRLCILTQKQRVLFPFWERLIEAQGGEFCCICKKSRVDLGNEPLFVNYDPLTFCVRGLLCSDCDFGTRRPTALLSAEERSFVENPPLKTKIMLNQMQVSKARRSKRRNL